MMTDEPIQQFLDELAGKAPTPGGGSAAAIMGAMGAALVGMACNLTLGKKGYEGVQDEIRQVLEQAESLRAGLTDMVRADMEAFDRVMQAYGLPRDGDERKQARSAAIQEALKAATEVPMECARACAEVVRLSRSVAEKGNRNVVSDAGVAVEAAYAALRSAALNVYVNTNAIQDAEFVASRQAELSAVLAGMGDMREAVYEMVRNRL